MLGHDRGVGGGLVLGDDGVRVVLTGGSLGGDDLGDLGRGIRRLIDGLDLLGASLGVSEPASSSASHAASGSTSAPSSGFW